MNFTSKRPKENDTWTTSRYLLPPRSKMTRLSPTKSTVPPNCRFISAGFAQRASAATATQARIGPSAYRHERRSSQLHCRGPFLRRRQMSRITREILASGRKAAQQGDGFRKNSCIRSADISSPWFPTVLLDGAGLHGNSDHFSARLEPDTCHG